MLYKFVAAIALSAPLAACMSAPSNLDQSLRKATDGARYVVALQPPADPIAVNRLHSWQIAVASPAGAPVLHAHIDVDGGMPQHGHGFPTRPRVTQELGEGRYLLEGMKFSMTGWWEIRLKVRSDESAEDTVTFNQVIAPRPTGKG